MKGVESTVSADGSVIIPAVVLESLGVKPGDTVCWYQESGVFKQVAVTRKVQNPNGSKLTQAISILIGSQDDSVGDDSRSRKR